MLAINFLHPIKNQQWSSNGSNLLFHGRDRICTNNFLFFLDDNLFLKDNANTVNNNSMIFNGQSKCITNDLTSPNLESNLSELIDFCKQNINNP